MERKEFGELNINRNDAVFVAITADYVLPSMYGKQAGQTIEVVLMQLRWDGRIGFPGGKIDNNESLKQAIVREALEKGFDTFMKNNFASSVREELYILGKEINPLLESQKLNKSFSEKALYLK